ncbi:hypothetical protein SAMN06265370_1512 [Puniceibacterium sediminis]|uniref:Transposase n=1 Tax=Puniceibacterium sediminis TaxID=1608407 RepID=A0A239A0V1_9RHOB|nr:hypothetical protein SAMN06265370_1512 [Puniceibacterium sediminis]
MALVGAVLPQKLRRAQVLEFFGQLLSCVVAMEACGGAHFWGREIGKLGHDVRLIPAAYVKRIGCLEIGILCRLVPRGFDR